MSDVLNKTIVLVLNRNWQAINIRTPQEAFCQMATNVATALEIDGENHFWRFRRSVKAGEATLKLWKALFPASQIMCCVS